MNLKKLSEAARKYEKNQEKKDREKDEIDRAKKIKVKRVRKKESLPRKMNMKRPEDVPDLPKLLKKVSEHLRKKEEEKEKEEEGKGFRGMKIPQIETAHGKIKKKEEIDITKLSISYSLTPTEPKKGEEI